MEFDKEKSFGHPVLRPVFEGENIEEMDFVRAQFEPDFGIEVSVDEPSKALLDYEFAISLPEITKNLNEENLEILIDIRCKKTFFSKKFKVEIAGELEIDLSNLRDVVEIHPYIIATKEFEFSSKQIHPDFGYSSFTLKKGDIIAWHPAMPFSIEKEQYKSVRSIIDFQPDPSVPFGEYWLELQDDYVKVHANPIFIGHCKQAERISNAVPSLLASFYTPVISELFLVLATDASIADDLRWASIIRAKSEELKIEYDDPLNAIRNAQKLLGAPLKELTKNGFVS